MIKKILIANRGEIALRIIRALRELGIASVVVYSEADRETLPVMLADEAICIGAAPAKESYLRMDRILSAAIASGADAIHPGFGFLSENSRFSSLCSKCGLIFIGPSAEVIAKLGDKAAARECMKQAGVPIIPGSDGAVMDVREGLAKAEAIGYPVMIKASAGGGGKGMRIAYGPEDFAANYESAAAEAEKAFGNGELYLEKYLSSARHIEVQILGDTFGQVIHLGERDCSVQRRHQKLIEEAPAFGISEEMREAMGSCAVRAAKAAGYTGAGTVEFLLAPDGQYYFMEMNTRIQVEHGITELVTGVDLIQEQIRIADGRPLSKRQEEIRIAGHAFECRINAEDVKNGFRPVPGVIEELHLPGGNGVRIDTALYPGCRISPYYDSMLAKIMTWGETREAARMRMLGALDELVIEGVPTTAEALGALMTTEEFIRGGVDTGYVDRSENSL